MQQSSCLLACRQIHCNFELMRFLYHDKSLCFLSFFRYSDVMIAVININNSMFFVTSFLPCSFFIACFNFLYTAKFLCLMFDASFTKILYFITDNEAERVEEGMHLHSHMNQFLVAVMNALFLIIKHPHVEI